jgi:hypothetical protein
LLVKTIRPQFPNLARPFFLKRFLIFESKAKDQILDKDNYYSGGQVKHARDVREGLDFEESHDDHFKYPAAIVLQSFDQAISLLRDHLIGTSGKLAEGCVLTTQECNAVIYDKDYFGNEFMFSSMGTKALGLVHQHQIEVAVDDDSVRLLSVDSGSKPDGKDALSAVLVALSQLENLVSVQVAGYHTECTSDLPCTLESFQLLTQGLSPTTKLVFKQVRFEANDSSGGGGFAEALLDTKHALLELERCQFACEGKCITQHNGQSPFRLVVKGSFPCELDKLLFGIRNGSLSHLSICDIKLGSGKESESMMAIYNAAMNLNWKVIFRGKDHGGIEATQAREETLIFANVKVHSYSMNQLVEMDDDVLATIFKEPHLKSNVKKGTTFGPPVSAVSGGVNPLVNKVASGSPKQPAAKDEMPAPPAAKQAPVEATQLVALGASLPLKAEEGTPSNNNVAARQGLDTLFEEATQSIAPSGRIPNVVEPPDASTVSAENMKPLQNGKGMYRLFVDDDGTRLVEYKMFPTHEDSQGCKFNARQTGKGVYCGNCVKPSYWREGGCRFHRLT